MNISSVPLITNIYDVSEDSPALIVQIKYTSVLSVRFGGGGMVSTGFLLLRTCEFLLAEFNGSICICSAGRTMTAATQRTAGSGLGLGGRSRP